VPTGGLVPTGGCVPTEGLVHTGGSVPTGDIRELREKYQLGDMCRRGTCAIWGISAN
jgi:hypothetical protein